MTKPVLTNVETKSDYIKLVSGLDLVTPALEVDPGSLIDCGNFVPDISGGYRTVGGYERFDGRAKPSAAIYYMMTLSGTWTAAFGDFVVGGTSGATGIVTTVLDDAISITSLTGFFEVGEVLTIGAGVGAVVETFVQGGATTLLQDVTCTADAADFYRSLILPVPGSGPIRGVHVYGNFVYAWRDSEDGTELLMYSSSSSGWNLVAGVPTLAPGGRVVCVNHNFNGGASTEVMLGCDGKNLAFQFDGTTYTQITSTAVPDTPSAIAVHLNRLFLANLGSLFLSSPGDPVTGWVGVGATPAELGVGAIITDLLPLKGNNQTSALAVFCRNKTSILYGNSTSTWDMVTLSRESGARPGTAQSIGVGVYLDVNSVTTLAAVQEFGNFAAASISTKVQPMLNGVAKTATASSLLRAQNQYRLWFGDGTGLAFRMDGSKVKAACPIVYPVVVRTIFSGDDAAGEEVIFFGSDDGYIYQAEMGTSFDGVEIDAWIRLAFNSARGPSVRKSWRRARVDVSVPEYAEISCAYEHDYGDFEYGSPTDNRRSLTGNGANWDTSMTWDAFIWDSPYLEPPVFKLDGTSSNLSLVFSSNSRLSQPFAIQSVLIHYTPRRLDRRAA